MKESKAKESSNLKSNLSPRSWVTTRIWGAIDKNQNYSEPKKEIIAKGGQVGHASVETNFIHSSYWPSVPPSKNLKTPVSAFHSRDSREDKEREGRKYDLKANFYSLDEKKVDAELKKFDTEKPGYFKTRGWSAKGSKFLNEYKGENCSGLSYRLLKAGGINELSSTCAALENKSVISPNDLFECIKHAKQKELALFPETEHFTPIERCKIG